MPEPTTMTVTFGHEDILELRPSMTEEDAKQLFAKVSKTLSDRLIEEGNSILDNLIWFYTNGDKQ